MLAVLGAGGKHDIFRVVAHEASKPVFRNSTPEINESVVDERIRKRCGISIDTKRITWSSIFKVSYGVCNSYNSGDIFLLRAMQLVCIHLLVAKA